MIYKLENDIIKVFDKTQFNPKHILECGQVFRFGIDKNGNYFVISKDNKATIIEKDNCYEIISNNPDYFVNYFDLNTDYNEIKTALSKNETLSKMNYIQTPIEEKELVCWVIGIYIRDENNKLYVYIDSVTRNLIGSILEKN